MVDTVEDIGNDVTDGANGTGTNGTGANANGANGTTNGAGR